MIEQILTPAGKTPATPFTPTPLPISPSPAAKSNTSALSGGSAGFSFQGILGGQGLLFEQVGKAVGEAVESAAKTAALKIHKDKEEFMNREQNRVNTLLQDKLTSMKKIMQY
mmetsp:Transcript_21471/g.28786  ORF Transcript_21471/g.28786 Transcript_21471/m.28786 type:complete len:112 (+) Transcript_21471:382-717(+)